MHGSTEGTLARDLLTATARASRDILPVLQALHGRIERALLMSKFDLDDPERNFARLAEDVLEGLDQITGSALKLQQELDDLWQMPP